VCALQTEDGKVGDYIYRSYSQVNAIVKDVASSIAGLGVKKGDRVGVFGANCPEWMITMQVWHGSPFLPRGPVIDITNIDSTHACIVFCVHFIRT
jgi:hypothetical protein